MLRQTLNGLAVIPPTLLPSAPCNSRLECRLGEVDTVLLPGEEDTDRRLGEVDTVPLPEGSGDRPVTSVGRPPVGTVEGLRAAGIRLRAAGIRLLATGPRPPCPLPLRRRAG